MNLHKPGIPKMTVFFFLAMLLLTNLILGFGQTPRAANDSAKVQGAVRIGVAFPRVTVMGGSGTGSQEVNFLRKNIRSYLSGPRIGTVELAARLDSLALEEAKERQCDYVLYLSLIRRNAPAGTGSRSAATKVGDEFTFEYKLISTQSTQSIATNIARKRVAYDGEDVLTPLLETAAQQIADLTQVASLPSTSPSPSNPVKAAGGVAPPSTSNAKPPTKSEGLVRIGVVKPRVTHIGGGASATNEAGAMQKMMSDYLTGPTIEPIEVKALLTSSAIAECGKRECDYILLMSLTRKRRTDGKGAIGSIMNSTVGSQVNAIPGSRTARQVTAGAVSIAAFVRANDELNFEYKLLSVADEALIVAQTVKSKVKSDGEDLLTPMIEAAAQNIMNGLKEP